MTVKLGSLKADLGRERDGDWVPIPDLPGVELKVRGFNYGPYLQQKSLIEMRWVRKYGRDPVPPEIAYRANAQLYADYILLDWKGFDVAYAPETALETLLDPAYRELHDHIRYAGMKVGLVEADFVEDAEKNSARPCATT